MLLMNKYLFIDKIGMINGELKTLEAAQKFIHENISKPQKRIQNLSLILQFSFLFYADRSFVVANNQPNSCHIIFCSDGFCKMTGFTRAEVSIPLRMYLLSMSKFSINLQ